MASTPQKLHQPGVMFSQSPPPPFKGGARNGPSRAPEGASGLGEVGLKTRERRDVYWSTRHKHNNKNANMCSAGWKFSVIHCKYTHHIKLIRPMRFFAFETLCVAHQHAIFVHVSLESFDDLIVVVPRIQRRDVTWQHAVRRK